MTGSQITRHFPWIQKLIVAGGRSETRARLKHFSGHRTEVSLCLLFQCVLYASYCNVCLFLFFSVHARFLLTKQIHCIYLNFKRLCLSSLKMNFEYTNGYHLLTTSQHRTFSSLCPVIYLQPLMFDDFVCHVNPQSVSAEKCDCCFS